MCIPVVRRAIADVGGPPGPRRSRCSWSAGVDLDLDVDESALAQVRGHVDGRHLTAGPTLPCTDVP